MKAERVVCESSRTGAERVCVKRIMSDEMSVAIAEVMKSLARERRPMSSGRVAVRPRMAMAAMTVSAMTMAVTAVAVAAVPVPVPTMASAGRNRRRRRGQDQDRQTDADQTLHDTPPAGRSLAVAPSLSYMLPYIVSKR